MRYPNTEKVVINADLDMKLRYAIARSKSGDAFSIPLNGERFEDAQAAAVRIARYRNIELKCEITPAQRIKCSNMGRLNRPKFEMDALAIAGDKKEFIIDPYQEGALRTKASMHARSLGLHSKVERLDIGRYLVRLLTERATRDQGAQVKIGKVGRPSTDPTALKYPYGNLAVGEAVLINEPSQNHQRVRIAASAYAKRTQWKLSCRAEGDAIRVTRTA